MNSNSYGDISQVGLLPIQLYIQVQVRNTLGIVQLVLIPLVGLIPHEFLSSSCEYTI